MRDIGFDERAIKIGPKRELLIGGSIHYPRSTPAMWPKLMKLSREAHLNTISTYVFWNLHERRPGVFDFSGRLALRDYLGLAQQHGLNVILRIGPYICAETNYGGFPAWLRDVPDIRMRTFNKPFMREMERWVRFVCDYVEPMYAPNGGAVILVQLENEYANVAKLYGDDGERYLQWVAELKKSLNIPVPLIMCLGAADNVLETINDFYGHNQLDDHFSKHSNQPALWTENWPAWYNTFGYLRNTRKPEYLAYGVARFFAGGGTGVNYYPWHGGTNFNRESMYLQTTSYDFDAPLDEFGLPTTKYYHIRQLHKILMDNSEVLLACRRATPQPLGDRQAVYIYRAEEDSLAFLCNDDDSVAGVSFDGLKYNLPPRSVLLIKVGQVLMNTAEVHSSCRVTRVMCPLKTVPLKFEWWAEPIGGGLKLWRATAVSNKPTEQLKLTKDETDYCWYSTTFTVQDTEMSKSVLTLEGVADVVHIFIDGTFVATSPTLLKEFRGPIDGEGFVQSFHLELRPGTYELSLLCCALGLVKHENQLGYQNMVGERKGFWGKAYRNGNEISGPWTIQSGLVGERCRIFAEAGDLVCWESGLRGGKNVSVRWWRTTFGCPESDEPLALDLHGMNKGLVWLNGQCLGRYWLVHGTTGCHQFSEEFNFEGRGEPTQRYYHVPTEWIAEHNSLVLFEELGGDPTSVCLCQWSKRMGEEINEFTGKSF